ncbi:hypothetical protein SAMN05216524_101641 [Mucilaginibacter sp. OK098]|nr:hypothetical protein SAMN05216524_101641 [Mucilaginibacter sp. OK098]
MELKFTLALDPNYAPFCQIKFRGKETCLLTIYFSIIYVILIN